MLSELLFQGFVRVPFNFLVHSISNIWMFKVVMSTFISINIARLFRPANPQNAKIIIPIKYAKREIIFVYLPNTSHFMHFQSVRQKKRNIHNNTNKYRWHFWSKPQQTPSLKAQASSVTSTRMRYTTGYRLRNYKYYYNRQYCSFYYNC